MKTPSSLPASGIHRRNFIKGAGVALAGAACGRGLAAALAGGGGVTIVADPADPVASSSPAAWAVGELMEALRAVGAGARVAGRLAEAPAADTCIVVSGPGGAAREILVRLGRELPAVPEALCLCRGVTGGRDILLAAGSDPLGVVYAVTELADRVRCLRTVPAGLEFSDPLIERPASRVRSILRAFCSEVEDKEWFHDREFWRPYLTTLASSRVNRFNLSFGMGYNSAFDVTDGYFVLPYPFFVDVPGYSVRAAGLPDEERARNLATLRFIGEETVRRGLRFQLGIWTHAYRWPKSPHPTYAIQGLTDETHAPYCRDGLAILLRECPAIGGLTFRVHSESGIFAGESGFWNTLFEAPARCGRRVELDLHAKNVPQETLDVALATGQPVVMSPKYCGEHMGLPYHPASIREFERSPPGSVVDTGSGLSRGNRKFSRYGYADLLAVNRGYDVLFRIWPGTRRHLLSGDPATFAGFGRNAGFCGALGVELCEPLTFKGRMGSGLPGGRCAYADPALTPRRDFEKFLPTYRLWGRLTYDPDAKPDAWERHSRRDFGAAGDAAADALAHASRVLPLVTLAHAPSADCTLYWPEVYTSMPIVDAGRPQPYTDASPPKLFGNMGSFDPQLFASPDECADGLLEGRVSGRYSPLEVAQWLEDLASAATSRLDEARARAGAHAASPEFRRLEEDVLIQRGLALFFAGKLRSAVLWRIHRKTGGRPALEEAVKAYAAAGTVWAAMSSRADKVYRSDLSYGDKMTIRGHWTDRAPAIDGDIADMRAALAASVRREPDGDPGSAKAGAALRLALQTPRRAVALLRHRAPPSFAQGDAVPIEAGGDPAVSRAVLHYRLVNQAERWMSAEMTAGPDGFRAEIPAAYTRRRYPLQYYIEAFFSEGGAAFVPALAADLSNVPYSVIPQRKG